jgi:putative glycosyltransferase
VDLSVVATLYRSAPYVEEFYRRVNDAARAVTRDYEIVLVNDGSPDESLERAVALHEGDPRVRVIDLSRNFGHHKAMMAGLAHARGGLVFLLDSDLEEDPELLGRFHGELRASGADVVFGVQNQRRGGLVERWSGSLFFTLFNLLTDHPLPRNLVTVRLMTRRYLDALLLHEERETVVAGLWAITGFKQVALGIDKHARAASTYNLRRKLVLLVDSVTSFSDRPLILIFYLGCLILLLSSLGATYLIIRRLFFGVLLGGWPSLIVSVWLLGGITIFCLGILGIYLSKVFIETKRRPSVVVRHVYERPASGGTR